MANLRVTTTLAAVLTAARDRLVAAGAFAESCADLSIDPDAPPSPPPGERFCSVTFGDTRQPPEAVSTDAPTTEIPVVESELVVHAFLRVQLDSPGRADALLTDAELGASAMVSAILLALSNYDPVNSDSDFILLRSLTFLGVAAREVKGGFRRFDVRFNACFAWNLGG